MPELPRFLYAISSVSGDDSTIGQWVEGDSAADLKAFDVPSEEEIIPTETLRAEEKPADTMAHRIRKLFCCA
jgi:hypothetical protein